VAATRRFLLEAIPRCCDFVFANEDEFIALSGSSVAEGIGDLNLLECGFVVKLGSRGAAFTRRGETWESPVRAQVALDETGAGDAFAAGFLSGFARGLSPERCLRLGNRIAEEVIAVPGLRVEGKQLQRAQLSVLG
jgi:sugar/nucleoside kinase (ribokinase family)